MPIHKTVHGTLTPFSRSIESQVLDILVLHPSRERADALVANLGGFFSRRARIHSLSGLLDLAGWNRPVDAIVLGPFSHLAASELLRKVESLYPAAAIVAIDGVIAPAELSRAADLGVHEQLPAHCADCGLQPMLASSIEWALERKRLFAELKAAREAARHSALHDELTGLANLRLYRDRLAMMVAQARRMRRSFCLLFIDLDDFKSINDEFGHQVGDALLKEFAARLADSVRQTDTVARRGGDEFAIILDGIERDLDALEIAKKLLGRLQEPFHIQGRELKSTASIGIAFYPRNGTYPESLESVADRAMYSAKQSGGDQYHLEGVCP